jgi:hypothetical protein
MPASGAASWRPGRISRGPLILLAILAQLAMGPARAQEWGYSVQGGDTIWDLARRHLKNPDDWLRLQQLNGIDEPRHLLPGTRLRFPFAWLRLDGVPARVSAVNGSANVRRAGGEQAVMLQVGETVQAGDVVETAPDATAELAFVDGSTLILAGASQLVLDGIGAHRESGATDTQVDLTQGRIDTAVQPADPAASRFEVRTVPAVSSVRGTEFRVAVEPEGARASTEVVDGRVAVAAAGRQRQVAALFGVVTDKGRAPGRPRPLLPAPPREALPTLLDRVPIALAPPPQPGAVGWRWALLAVGAGDAPLFERAYDRSELRGPDLPDGLYRMRLRAIDADGLEGLDREWRVEIDARPEPPAQLRPQHLGRVRESRPVFAWARQDGIVGYRLQVAADPSFGSPVVDIAGVEGAELESPVELAPGSWYWRVAARDASDEGPFGDPQPFERRDPPTSTVEPPELDEDRLVIRVRGGSPGQRYQFQLAETRDFFRPVVDRTLAVPELVVARPLPGQYYLRTRIIDDDGYEGQYGPIQQIDVPPTSWWPAVVTPLVMLLLLAL